MRDKLISRKEAAVYFNISVRTLDRRTKAGKIPCYRVGRRVLFSLNRIKEILESEYLDFNCYLEGPDGYFLSRRKAKQRIKRVRMIRKLKSQAIKLLNELRKMPYEDPEYKDKYNKLVNIGEKIETLLNYEWYLVEEEIIDMLTYIYRAEPSQYKEEPLPEGLKKLKKALWEDPDVWESLSITD